MKGFPIKSDRTVLNRPITFMGLLKGCPLPVAPIHSNFSGEPGTAGNGFPGKSRRNCANIYSLILPVTNEPWKPPVLCHWRCAHAPDTFINGHLYQFVNSGPCAYIYLLWNELTIRKCILKQFHKINTGTWLLARLFWNKFMALFIFKTVGSVYQCFIQDSL